MPGLEACRDIWQRNRTLDEVAQKLRYTRLRSCDNVEQPAVAITQAPSAWAILEGFDALESVQWLLDTYLFGKLAALKLLQTGEAVPLEQEEAHSASIRLETLIKVTEQRRKKWIRTPNEILSETTFKALYDEWKYEYKAWMNLSSQYAWYRVKGSGHVWLRTRFRNFLFKMCGCQDLVLFWLRVPASAMSLRIFKEVFVDGEEETTIKMNRAVQAVRDWLRAPVR